MVNFFAPLHLRGQKLVKNGRILTRGAILYFESCGRGVNWGYLTGIQESLGCIEQLSLRIRVPYTPRGFVLTSMAQRQRAIYAGVHTRTAVL